VGRVTRCQSVTGKLGEIVIGLGEARTQAHRMKREGIRRSGRHVRRAGVTSERKKNTTLMEKQDRRCKMQKIYMAGRGNTKVPP